jgi:hypothetical protein
MAKAVSQSSANGLSRLLCIVTSASQSGHPSLMNSLAHILSALSMVKKERNQILLLALSQETPEKKAGLNVS